MTNAELAERLNSEIGLTGGDAVTVNVVRQWVGWKVLPKAEPEGQSIGQNPIWIRSEAIIGRARRLAELRKAGVRRENAVITQAYLEWGHPDFSEARNAILKEFIKWRNQFHRKQITFMDDTGYQGLSKKKKDAIANQLGPLEKRFAGTQFQLLPETYALIGNISRIAEGSEHRAEFLISSALQQIVPSFGEQIPESVISAIAMSFRGLTGLPDEIENSGQETIENATESQFEIAREATRQILEFLSFTRQINSISDQDGDIQELMEYLHSLASQISVGPWAIFLFAQILHSVVNDSNREWSIEKIGGIPSLNS